LANLIKNKVGFKGNIFFDKRYPNGVAKKNLNYERIKKLNWRPEINLTKGLDIILKYEKINL
jgi:GDP-L-fucose synthase